MDLFVVEVYGKQVGSRSAAMEIEDYSSIFSRFHKMLVATGIRNIAFVPYLGSNVKHFKFKYVSTNMNVLEQYIFPMLSAGDYKYSSYKSVIEPGVCAVIKRKQMNNHKFQRSKLVNRVDFVLNHKEQNRGKDHLNGRLLEFCEYIGIESVSDLEGVKFRKLRDFLDRKEDTMFVKISSCSTGQERMYMAFKEEEVFLSEEDLKRTFETNAYGLSTSEVMFPLPGE